MVFTLIIFHIEDTRCEMEYNTPVHYDAGTKGTMSLAMNLMQINYCCVFLEHEGVASTLSLLAMLMSISTSMHHNRE